MSRNILMLEHDEDDRYITQAVFDESNYNVKIKFVNTSEEVFAHLSGCAKNKAQFPALILLNYHAAPSNAVEILKVLRANDNYRHIPVVVLSGSVHEDIIRECYASGASSFIKKPSRSDETSKKIANFFHYWFQTVELP